MMRRSLALAAVVVTALINHPVARPQFTAAPPVERTTFDALRQLKALPLAFEVNRGQTSGAASFVARGQGYAVWATAAGPVLQLRRGSNASAVVRMRVVGGMPTGDPLPESLLPGRANYFIGNEPSRWKTGIARYGALRYADVYQGIDLVLHGSQESLEYDFDVEPYTDPSRIAVRFDGARARLAADGGLTLTLDDGEIGFRAPVAYQTRNGAKELVEAHYAMDADDSVRFTVGPYDHARPLTIDPVLSYSTYLGGTLGQFGGNGNDKAFAIAVDALGYAYLAGFTSSIDFPVAGSPYDTSCAGCTNSGGDAWVAKIDPTQSGAASLVFTTYLGAGGTGSGTGSSFAYGVATDINGNVYVTGNTGGFDNPVTPTNEAYPTTAGAFQPNSGGGLDAFLTKLNASGSALLYSTYIGGNNTDEGSVVKVDSAGHAYVAGWAASTNFPEIFHGFKSSPPSPQFDGFVVKLDTNQSGAASLLYGTLVGGGSQDRIGAMAVDALGRVYVTGLTQSYGADPFPTLNGFQTVSLGGQDGFMTMIDPALTGASSLLYSTYVGSNGTDGSSQNEGGIAVDAQGMVYVTGTTYGGTFPTTAGAFKSVLEQSDAYVVKIDPSQIGASSLIASTLLGGTFQEGPTGLAIDQNNDPVIVGWTGSSNLGVAACAPKPGGTDGFVAIMDQSLGSVKFSALLGGFGTDIIYGIGLGPAGQIYVGGYTESANFPTTTDSLLSTAAYDATQTGQDAFMSVIAPPFGTCAAPVASGQSVSTPEDTAKSITLTAVDADGSKATPDSLTWKIVTAPVHGTLDLTAGLMTHVSANYSAPVVYTPAPNYNGPDSFQFRVSDGWFTSAIVTVTIGVTPVNDAPAANSQAVTTAEETPKAITLTGNDPEGQSLAFTVTVNPAHGTLSGSGAARTYSPALDYFGPDQFAFTVTDAGGAVSAAGIVSITVINVNDAPLAMPDSASTDDNTLIVIPVLANDSDPDGDALQLGPIVTCQHGTATVNADQTITYQPQPGFGGADVCTYSVSDAFGGTGSGQVTVTVTVVNAPPALNNPGNQLTAEGGPVSLQLTASDPDGDPLTFTPNGLPSGLTIDANGLITGAPAAGSAGSYPVTVTVKDGHGGEDSVSFTWVVTPPAVGNQAPVCTAAQPSQHVLWPADRQLVPIAIVGVVDPDGDQPAITVTRILQDEPTNTFGDGSTWIDGFGIGTSTASVRAERVGTPKLPGDGRVYEIFFTASDSHGGTCAGSVVVSVPHDQSAGPAIDSLVRYDSTAPGAQPIRKD